MKLHKDRVYIFAFKKKETKSFVLYENNSVVKWGGYRKDKPVSIVSFYKKYKGMNICLSRAYQWIFQECEEKKVKAKDIILITKET